MIKFQQKQQSVIVQNHSKRRIRNRLVCRYSVTQVLPSLQTKVDNELSMREIKLDPEGYFIIKVDDSEKTIIAELYSNSINDKGQACDSDTGEVIGCKKGGVRYPRTTYKGVSAKDLCVKILEQSDLNLMQDHAAYLGREFQKAEIALLYNLEYVQD
eukprot:TRINITY_DN6379_c1_g1_i1.p1 TRINITY_DN6379_c1_g1~~TRINITY_DN6379_c1_g1_i1.p1  ORF type:complete len:180 (-),score=8.52 TRINITY_DN6379_c1_g1_i1:304-774(-)